MTRFRILLALTIAIVAGGVAAIAVAATQTTGTVSVCAGGKPVMIGTATVGTEPTNCVTTTYTVPTTTVTQTVTAPPTTSSTSTTASTSTTTSSTTTTAPAGCNLSATTSTFAAQYAALTSGQTLCLASGSYGTFTGSAKSGRVTIHPATGAKVDMTVNFNGASNITLTGITLDNATLQGATSNVTLSNSTVPASGQIVVLTDSMTASSNLVISGDTLANQSCTAFALAGRIDVEDAGANNGNPVGLTISGNTLSGGTADGIRLDSGSGIQVLNNTFTQFDDVDPCHTDDIQFAGSDTHPTINGNFFYAQTNTADCSISGFNGVDHMTFENNVVAGPSSGCADGTAGDGAMALYGDAGSIIEHNVIAPGEKCAGNPCDLGLEFAAPSQAGTGTIIRDNVMAGVSNGDTAHGTTYTEDHNLCTDGDCQAPGDLGTSAGDISAAPKFVGGANPTTYAGFELAAGSPGIGAASDGTNMGIK